LVGQAAVRTGDPAVARALLGRARELAPPPADGGAEAAGRGGTDRLTEREAEIGQLVLEGRTHKEIGAQLFLSPKTVEHHVARIRTKLGASTRAEMLAALNRELA
jgi:DNA-binding CsgD family transcriptional regulator